MKYFANSKNFALKKFLKTKVLGQKKKRSSQCNFLKVHPEFHTKACLHRHKKLNLSLGYHVFLEKKENVNPWNAVLFWKAWPKTGTVKMSNETKQALTYSANSDNRKKTFFNSLQCFFASDQACLKHEAENFHQSVYSNLQQF